MVLLKISFMTAVCIGEISYLPTIVCTASTSGNSKLPTIAYVALEWTRSDHTSCLHFLAVLLANSLLNAQANELRQDMDPVRDNHSGIKNLCRKDCHFGCCCRLRKPIHVLMKDKINGVFQRLGLFVGKHPLPFVVLPILICGGLGVGMLKMDKESDIEKSYFPVSSRALDDRQKVRERFPQINDINYNSFAQSDAVDQVTVIFQSTNATSVKGIFDPATLNEIRNIIDVVKNISVLKDGRYQNYEDLCARFNLSCVIEGEFILTPGFESAFLARQVTYPYWKTNTAVDLSFFLADVKTNANVMESANILKVSFVLTNQSKEWQSKFISVASTLSAKHSKIYYGTPESLGVELDKGTQGNVILFAFTIVICIVFASLVTMGGDPVSTRALLANGGILAAGLGIIASIGLLSLCGVKFVNIVGVMPFLTIGIGIDDMFLMMSSWSETIPNDKLPVPERLGLTFATAGIGITITALTDVLAFVIGMSSVFLSVTNFSIYTAISLLVCYINNLTLFGGCLALHGRRVYSGRHCYTCKKTKPRSELQAEGKSKCFALLCGGSIPKEEREDESRCEKLPRLFLPSIVTSTVARVIIIIFFLGYLAASIYGVVNLKQGLRLENLVPESSYYHSFLRVSDQYFPSRVPIGFVVHKQVDYSGQDGNQLRVLLARARNDSQIDSEFERCWLTAFANSSVYSATDFLKNFVGRFLPANPYFQNDVVLNENKTAITASRCYVFSHPITDQYQQADLMVRMRDIADASSLPVFAYHQAFVAFEQYLAVLPATLQMVGISVVVICVVTIILLPQVLMVCLVGVTIIMIMVGIFGFMYYWDITLSSITMIHLEMSVGFSVDFSSHVCSAYLVSNSESRLERAKDAIAHAASPIFNGGMSALLGVILLAFSDSYIFKTFFQIMLLVTGFGVLHAILFLPTVLSVIGPENKIEGKGACDDCKMSSVQPYNENVKDSHGHNNDVQPNNENVKDSHGHNNDVQPNNENVKDNHRHNNDVQPNNENVKDSHGHNNDVQPNNENVKDSHGHNIDVQPYNENVKDSHGHNNDVQPHNENIKDADNEKSSNNDGQAESERGCTFSKEEFRL